MIGAMAGQVLCGEDSLGDDLSAVLRVCQTASTPRQVFSCAGYLIF